MAYFLTQLPKDIRGEIQVYLTADHKRWAIKELKRRFTKSWYCTPYKWSTLITDQDKNKYKGKFLNVSNYTMKIRKEKKWRKSRVIKKTKPEKSWDVFWPLRCTFLIKYIPQLFNRQEKRNKIKV